jgi:hypothetical protein
MEVINQNLFFENIKKNSNSDKIQSIINSLKKQEDNEFINKYYSEKRTPLICII